VGSSRTKRGSVTRASEQLAWLARQTYNIRKQRELQFTILKLRALKLRQPDPPWHAAAAHSDLVIHVGDYVYREVRCPAGNTDCSNSPYGYGWEAWNVDFFEPSASLLAVAPWIMVRGNHETCDRAGDGWFRFLNHTKPPNECEKFGSSYVASYGDFGFVVMDSAEAADPTLLTKMRTRTSRVLAI
jgi:Calcineurin-like phosphoesterase